jgi:uncharacterized lipoprotein YddW (UPF0748 family)
MRIGALVLALSASSLPAAAPELRGTWVTTTGLTSSTSTIYSPAVTTTNFARLRTIGINSVYVDAWRNGNTYFPSQTLKAITGTQLAPDAGGRDIFGETLIQSHRNGMAQVAWLQYGFAAQFLDVAGSPSNSLATYMKNRGWLLQDSAGKYSNSSNKYAWMNPLVPEVRSLIINMGVEMVKNYDLDGIQFDDRLAWPVQFGYDDYTRQRYLTETGRQLPANPSDANFLEWRANKVTEFAKEFSTAIREANPNVIVSASPGVYGWVYNNYAVDSPQWSRETIEVDGVTRPLFDEIVPQVYNSTVNGFSNDWNYQLSQMDPAYRESIGVGISINNSAGAPYNWASINQPQVNAQRNATGTKGHIWWYSSGVLDTNEANLTAYYNVAANGQAARPDQAADWRSPPTVAKAAGGGVWSFTLAETQRYQIIVRSGNNWSILLNTVLPGGFLSMNLGTFSAVELLVDRRGFTPGDTDFDGAVDFDDLLVLAQNYGSAGKMWAQGDFTLDTKVDFDDLLVLAQSYRASGMLVDGTALGESFAADFAIAQSLVPEPISITMLCMLPVIARRRR